MINIGFIGFGKSGSVYHAPIVKTIEGLQVKRVITSRTELAHTHFKDALVTGDMEDVLNDGEIDLVIVCTPDSTHYEIAKKALEHGKHVVVEKPFVLDSQDGLDLIRIAKENHLMIFPYQNRRFDNDFLTARMLQEDGKLGLVYHFESTFNKLRPSTGESNPYGALFGLGSHLVDQAICFLGKPETVFLDILEKS
ncbi:MAG TPA: Gfo/Idh/MocA family oxidoreductase, partial [Clostridiaceae bacterium]|nr:Gfo/Idh/MocA family oxidoreductase [Clostridiaceae bacterium]